MATHAGVVIAGEKLAEQFPLYIDHSSNLTLPSTQYDMYSQKMLGWLNLIYHLKTLTVIDNTLKRLNKKIELDISKIDHNDKSFLYAFNGRNDRFVSA